MPEIVTEAGMLCGVRLDKGFDKLGMWSVNMDKGPLGFPECSSCGLDDVEHKAKNARCNLASFAKWVYVPRLAHRTSEVLI
eukprot:9310722-Alexandrium_andersonii.AAC.1